jgi:hypothetical protein
MHSVEKLEETLKKIGLEIPISRLKEIGYSEPTKEKNRCLFEKVNELLSEKIKEKFVESSIYVTGEMQVLRGRSFLVACREMNKEYGTKCEVIGHLPKIPYLVGNTKTVLEWWRDEWKELEWIDRINILYCISNLIVHLYALPKEEKVHFMVFANNCIFLQEEHRHRKPKIMWILVGETGVIEQFKLKAEEKKEMSQNISGMFRECILTINRPETLYLLSALYDYGSIHKSELLDKSRENLFLISMLKAAGFIRISHDTLSITDSGKKYIEFMLEENKGK